MTEETFRKALELNSQMQELDYRIERKLEDIQRFKINHKKGEMIPFYCFAEGSIQLTYKEALDKMQEQLHIDQQTLEMVQIQFSNL